MKERRQLAAILFTDIVGYTALMGQDEQQSKQIRDPKVMSRLNFSPALFRKTYHYKYSTVWLPLQFLS